jgi:lysozyme
LKRSVVASLSLSAAALVGIALHEGFRDTGYTPVAGDVPTIGFGHTGPDVRLGQKTTPDRALVVLLADASEAERGVKRCLAETPLYPWEYSAFVSLAYNIGITAFCNSTLVRKAKAGDYRGACEQILRWNKFKGRALPGLTKRRQAEYEMCVGKQV